MLDSLNRAGSLPPDTLPKARVAAPSVRNPVLVLSYVTRSTVWRRLYFSASSDPVSLVRTRIAVPMASRLTGFRPGADVSRTGRLAPVPAVGAVPFFVMITSCFSVFGRGRPDLTRR